MWLKFQKADYLKVLTRMLFQLSKKSLLEYKKKQMRWTQSSTLMPTMKG